MSSPQRRPHRRKSDVSAARTVESSAPSSPVHPHSPVRGTAEFTFSNFLTEHPDLSRVFEDVPAARTVEGSAPSPPVHSHSPVRGTAELTFSKFLTEHPGLAKAFEDVPAARTVEVSAPPIHPQTPIRGTEEFIFSDFLKEYPGLSKAFEDTDSSPESPTPVTVIEICSQKSPTIDRTHGDSEVPTVMTSVMSPPTAITLDSFEGWLADQSIMRLSRYPQATEPPDISEDDGDSSDDSLLKEIRQFSTTVRYSPFSKTPALQTSTRQSSISPSASLASKTSPVLVLSHKSRRLLTRQSNLPDSRTNQDTRISGIDSEHRKSTNSPVSRASSESSISQCRSLPRLEMSSPRVSFPSRETSQVAEMSELDTLPVPPILSWSPEYEKFLQQRTPTRPTSTTSYQSRESFGSKQDQLKSSFSTSPQCTQTKLDTTFVSFTKSDSELSVATELASPRRRSKTRGEIKKAQKSTAPVYTRGDASDSSLPHHQPSASYLDTASALFLERRRTLPRTRKPSTGKLPFSTAIDPHAVGLVVMQEALRENTRLMDQLRRDKESLVWRQRRGPCPCDVAVHPPHWTADHISNIHHYSFLLDTQGLRLSQERVVASNSRETIVAYNVPMVDGHPWKVKAEQVLRYVDVETAVGDQTAYNLLYYIQPCDRKMFVIVASDKVMGLVVAEELQWAHRILSETMMYRDLEEDPVPVRVGINRLWVHVSMRRQHLATTLCRIVGNFFYEGEKLHREDFAFNNVSDAGVAFAKMFLKTHSVPLYDGKTDYRSVQRICAPLGLWIC